MASMGGRVVDFYSRRVVTSDFINCGRCRAQVAETADHCGICGSERYGLVRGFTPAAPRSVVVISKICFAALVIWMLALL